MTGRSGSGEAARLEVRVKPRSSVPGVERAGDGAVVARVGPPAVDGRANLALCELLADMLGVARSRVRIVAGEKSRRKMVVVEGVSQAELDRVIGALSKR